MLFQDRAACWDCWDVAPFGNKRKARCSRNRNGPHPSPPIGFKTNLQTRRYLLEEQGDLVMRQHRTESLRNTRLERKKGGGTKDRRQKKKGVSLTSGGQAEKKLIKTKSRVKECSAVISLSSSVLVRESLARLSDRDAYNLPEGDTHTHTHRHASPHLCEPQLQFPKMSYLTRAAQNYMKTFL